MLLRWCWCAEPRAALSPCCCCSHRHATLTPQRPDDSRPLPLPLPFASPGQRVTQQRSGSYRIAHPSRIGPTIGRDALLRCLRRGCRARGWTRAARLVGPRPLDALLPCRCARRSLFAVRCSVPPPWREQKQTLPCRGRVECLWTVRCAALASVSSLTLPNAIRLPPALSSRPLPQPSHPATSRLHTHSPTHPPPPPWPVPSRPRASRPEERRPESSSYGDEYRRTRVESSTPSLCVALVAPRC